MKKTIYVLIGPPSVGKSTWIKKTFTGVKPYIINRDDLVDEVAADFGMTYNDMFLKSGDKEKLDQINLANDQVKRLFDKRILDSRGRDNIVVDMTNMSSFARKSALKCVQGQEDDYQKIAVVFRFKGFEDVIKSASKKRDLDLRLQGRNKTISDEVFDSMFARYDLANLGDTQIIDKLKLEGFDEVKFEDNTGELMKFVSEGFTHLKSFRQF